MSPRLRPWTCLLALFLAGAARADGEPRPPPILPAAASPAHAADLSGVAAPAAVAPPAAVDTLAPPSELPVALPAIATPSPPAPAVTAPAVAAELKKDAEVAAEVAPPFPAQAATAPLAQSVRRGDEVFARIRRSLGSNVCAAGENSERWRRRYASNPGAFANRIEQILPLLDFVSLEVERVGLPSEFTFIPLVESWYKPEAMGVGGPAGMWQMIGSTARNHGIHIQDGYDGRLSPVESTRAALSYLKVLHAMFGGWEATVMAYNAGEGRLMQAYARARSREASGDRRRPHGMSNITYDYVAKLQALSCLVSQPERNNLTLPRASRFVPLAPVLMDAGVSSLEEFAGRQGRSASDLRRLNPGYRSGRVVAGVPRLVLMPLGALQGAPQTAPATRTLPPDSSAAAVLAATRQDLQMLGLQSPRVQSSGLPVAIDASLVSSGTMTTASTPAEASPPEPTVAETDVAQMDPPVADPVAMDGAPTATHRVVAGESLWTIARLHQLDLDQLRQWNQLDRRAVVHPGQTLKLFP